MPRASGKNPACGWAIAAWRFWIWTCGPTSPCVPLAAATSSSSTAKSTTTGTCAASWRPGRAVAHHFGYRSPPGPVRAGRGGDVAAPARHVCLCHLGSRCAACLCRARPLWHQAAVLGADGRWRAAGIPGAGVAGHGAGVTRALRAGAGGLLAARQRAGAAHLVPGHSGIAGRALRLDR